MLPNASKPQEFRCPLGQNLSNKSLILLIFLLPPYQAGVFKKGPAPLRMQEASNGQESFDALESKQNAGSIRHPRVIRRL